MKTISPEREQLNTLQDEEKTESISIEQTPEKPISQRDAYFNSFKTLKNCENPVRRILMPISSTSALSKTKESGDIFESKILKRQNKREKYAYISRVEPSLNDKTNISKKEKSYSMILNPNVKPIIPSNNTLSNKNKEQLYQRMSNILHKKRSFSTIDDYSLSNW